MSDHRAILEAERCRRAAIRSERARFDRVVAATEAELEAVFARARERFTVLASVTWPRDDLGRPVECT